MPGIRGPAWLKALPVVQAASTEMYVASAWPDANSCTFDSERSTQSRPGQVQTKGT